MPHSEITGSKPACGSPVLFAAYRVLHRLPLPRHSLCALSSLTTKNRSSRDENHLRCCNHHRARKTRWLPFIICRCQRTKKSWGALPAAGRRGLVGVSGFEPETSSLSGTRSNQLSYTPLFSTRTGGAEGIRTPDVLLAKQVLYQLSYGPGGFKTRTDSGTRRLPER